MAYRLVAIDLDDTFIDSKNRFTPRTLQAVEKTLAKGVEIVIATGRMYGGMKPFYDLLSLTSPSIVYGGAAVVDKDGNTLYSSLIPHELTKKVLLFAQSIGMHAQIYRDDQFLFVKQNEFSKWYETSNKLPGVEAPDLLEQDDLSTPKILMIDHAERIAKIKGEAGLAFPELSVGTSKPTYLEINMPGANKGTALRFLTGYYGITREQVIAIGDSAIDLAMIEYAGLGVAVSNAVPQVRESADYVTLSNDEGGVAHVLEKFVLAV